MPKTSLIRSIPLQELLQHAYKAVRVTYKLVKDNCFQFVAKIMELMGIQQSLVDRVYEANKKSVKETTKGSIGLSQSISKTFI
jgi:hypothetical protein